MLHKILTAAPSAFNITTILSQAAQLSNQGKWGRESGNYRFTVLSVNYLFLMRAKESTSKRLMRDMFVAAQQSNQSPMSLTSDASSPRSYVSPRISTPQTNAGPLKPLLSSQPVISQPKVRENNHVSFVVFWMILNGWWEYAILSWKPDQNAFISSLGVSCFCGPYILIDSFYLDAIRWAQ